MTDITICFYDINDDGDVGRTSVDMEQQWLLGFLDEINEDRIQ
jgi:hypothetical protein